MGATVFSPIPYIPRVPDSYFFGFLRFVLGKKKEGSKKLKREEEQRR